MGAQTGFVGIARERECLACGGRWFTYEVNGKGLELIRKIMEG